MAKKPFLPIAKVEQETIELRIKKATAQTIEDYAKFRECTMGEIVDALSELIMRDKDYKAHLKAKKSAEQPA